MKKLLFYVAIALFLILVSVSVILTHYAWMRFFFNRPLWYYLWVSHLYLLPFTISGIVFCIFKIVKCVKSPQVSYPIRYTYEQYKEYRENKKSEKKQTKKDKLRNQLNELEKD